MGTLFVTRKELAEGLKLPSNQRTRIVLVPKAICASLMGAAFDSNKTFLLPQCIPGLRLVHELLVERPQAELLVVAHTDASGEPAVNDPLSLARAEMAQAWFKDDVDAWLANYDAGVPKSQRWGVREDNLMVRHMPGFDQRERGASDRGTRTEDPISWFQRTRRLKVDGIAGRQTRRALVTEYFALARPSPSGNDDTEASAEAPDPPSVAVTAHGAGENYPLSVIQPILDARKKKSSFTAAGRTPAPVEDDDEPLDRRVEFFVFSKETGIEPAPGAPDGPEYLQWVTDATLRREVIVEDTRLRLPVVEFADVLFNTNSAVPLPVSENGTPSNAEGAEEGAPFCVARVLTYAYTHADQGLHVSGHTDTTADANVNDPLSGQRASTVLALIEGDRDAFKGTADEQCVDADKDTVLHWASVMFGFGSALEEHRGNRVSAIKAFQASYNDSAERNDAGQAKLKVDGDFGPQTWGATFDLYEAEVADLLDGEAGDGDRELLKAYRDALRFADDENKARGYGERYPIEHKRKNNFRSKRNRRVEVLFFDPEESPNLGVPPENSTVFDDAVFTKVPLPVGGFEPLGIRYAFLPTEHTEKRSFPKPSCLPLLRRIVDTARQSPSLKVVVVGHTDHLLADDDNEKLSLARADAVKALITHDLAFFKRRFEAADPLVPWDFEEVQWMLHALSSVAGPFYVGETDGHAGYMTRRALGAYQLTKGMNVDNGCDVETLEALCKDYLALIPEALEADRIRTVAGGSWTPRLVGEGAADDAGDDETAGAPPEGNLEVPSFNGRVEVFLFERPVVPAAESIDPSTRRASPTYRAWARRADPQEVSTPVQYAIRLMDGRRVPVPGVPFKILRLDIETGEFADFSSGSLDAFGTTSVKLPPGPYRVDFSLGNEQHSCGLHSHVDHSAGLGVRLRGAG